MKPSATIFIRALVSSTWGDGFKIEKDQIIKCAHIKYDLARFQDPATGDWYIFWRGEYGERWEILSPLELLALQGEGIEDHDSGDGSRHI